MLGSGRISQGLSPTLPLSCGVTSASSEALSASLSSFAKWGGERAPSNPHRDGQIKPFSGMFGEMRAGEQGRLRVCVGGDC